MITWLLSRLMAWGLSRPNGKIPFAYVIPDYLNDRPYLTRLVPWRLLGLRPLLHHFHQGDGDRALHNHPWKWSLSIILKGSYTEERIAREHPLSSARRTVTRKVRWFNLLRDTDFHRVAELHGDVWTLFITGPRTQDWGFLEGGRVVPHEEYIARMRRDAK